MKDWHMQSLDEVCEMLNVDRKKGLCKEESKRRLLQYGYNRLESAKKVNPFKMFLNQFSDLMIMVLLFAAMISFFLGERVDGITVLLIVALNGVLGFVQEYKAERTLGELMKMTAPQAMVLRDEKWQTIRGEELVIGDVVLIEAGDIVPADLRLVEEVDLQTDEAMLSGEAEYIRKDAKMILGKRVALSERCNMAFMGTTVMNGHGVGVVVATAMASELGRIAGILEPSIKQITPLEKKLDQLGKVLVGICFLLVGMVALIGVMNGENIYNMFLVGVALAVAAIPEGLPAIVTVALALGVRRMLAREAIIRRLPAIETLGCTTVICTDKTGTLTYNQMAVKEIHHPFRDETEKRWLDSNGGKNLIRAMVLCNNGIISDSGEESGSATELALVKWVKQYGYENLAKGYERLRERAFSSERKMMSVLCKCGIEQYLYAKGAPEVILAKCKTVYDGNQILVLDEVLRKKILCKCESLAQYARVLAFAGSMQREVSEEENSLTFYGMVDLADPLRKEIKDAVDACKSAGIRVIMITGDHPKTAQSIGKEAGIWHEDSLVISGGELAEMNDRKLERILKKATIFARVSPEDKLRIVKCLQKQGHVVAMSGDGVNDAPAIKQADIGIAMGDGSEVTKEAAKMILVDNNFATIVGAIEEGRGIYSNIRKFIRYLLACNVGEVLTMLFATILALPIPLLPIQILWINLITDGLPAMALGVDPKEKDLMYLSPRDPKEHIFARGLWFKILSRGLWIAFITLVAYIFFFKYSDSLEYAQSGAFAALVMAQLFFVLDCRSERHSVFEMKLTENKYLLFAVVISALLQVLVIQAEVMNGIFHTVPLDLFSWMLIVLLSSVGSICFGIYRMGMRLLGK